MQVTDFSNQNPSKQRSPLTTQVVVIDYAFGNVRSVMNALEALGAIVSLSRNADDLRAADHLILPGVGAFGEGMDKLKQFGLIPLLNELVLEQKKPFLGICVGMQLLAKKGYEGGEYDGLGWVEADVVRFDVDKTHSLKVPHVGWNDVVCTGDNPLLGPAGTVHSYYFVHSYHMRVASDVLIGSCEYGAHFPAVIQKDNIFAVQFHPEKSQKPGLKLLENFLRIPSNREVKPC